jgi:hypothetical protein
LLFFVCSDGGKLGQKNKNTDKAIKPIHFVSRVRSARFPKERERERETTSGTHRTVDIAHTCVDSHRIGNLAA